MNSSKVFKADTLFTPHSLVRQYIDPPSAMQEDFALESEQIPQTDPHEADQEPNLAPSEEELAVEPSQDPPPESAPPQPPEEPPPPPEPQEPEVDIEAIWQEGYNQGSADLAAQMQAAMDQAIHSLVEACQKIDSLHDLRMASSHTDMVNLVISLTEKVLGQELSTPRNHIAHTLESALEQAIAGEEFHVTLHPDDLAFAEERAPALIKSIRGLEHLVFKADPSVRRGGCLLESVSCTVDATVEGKLESARELLTEYPELLKPVDKTNESDEMDGADPDQEATNP